MDGYIRDIETQTVRFFESLCERDRRRYAAVEASKLGHGGVAYICRLLDCDPKTQFKNGSYVQTINPVHDVPFRDH